MATLSGNILNDTKLLSAFTQQAMTLQDTPALIQWVAADADRMLLCHAVVCADQGRDPVFYQRLQGICQPQGVSVSRLQQRLVPVSRSLGLLQPDKETDHYQTLGVAAEADEEKIRAAYRAKARLLHPDTRPGGNTESNLFIALNIAYQTLIDPERRRQYDLKRELSRIWLEGCDEPVAQRAAAPVRLKPVMQLGAVVLALVGCVFLVNAYYHNRVLREGRAVSTQRAPLPAVSATGAPHATERFSPAVVSNEKGHPAPDTEPAHGSGTPDTPENVAVEAAKPPVFMDPPGAAPETPLVGADRTVLKEGRSAERRPVTDSLPYEISVEAAAEERERKPVPPAVPSMPVSPPEIKPSRASVGTALSGGETHERSGSSAGAPTAAKESIERFLARREQARSEKARQVSSEQVGQRPIAQMTDTVFITAGDWVEVKVDGLALRGTPRMGGEKLAALPIGFRAKVLEGPVRADDFIWWQVEAAEGERGWVAEKKALLPGNAPNPIQMLAVVSGPARDLPSRQATAGAPPSESSGTALSLPAFSSPLPSNEHIQEFLDRFSSLYAGKDLSQFASQFETGATENGKPFLDLLPIYRKSFSNMEGIEYRIALQRYAFRPASGTIAVKGRYQLHWHNKATGADLEDEGAIELELGFHGGSGFKVNNMQYRSSREM